MGDFDKLEYCPSCESEQMFIMSGSGRKGICQKCGNEVYFSERKDFTPSKSKIYKGITYDQPRGTLVEYEVVRTNGQRLHCVYDTDGFFVDAIGLTDVEKRMIAKRFHGI